jgi:uncharacterized membrane protein
MAVLPEGFALPPLPYLLVLVVGLWAVGALLRRRRPPVTGATIRAFVPWMILGAALHVLYALEALPTAVRPLAGTPSVYLSVAVVAGATWLGAAATDAGTARRLRRVGILLALPVVAAVLAVGAAAGTLRIGYALGILVGAAVATAATWGLLRRLRPDVTATGRLGVLAVGAHALDGVSTAIGIDLLGFAERTPLSRLVIEFGASLPVAPGGGWLFVLVKLVVAGVVVAALAETVREEPRTGRLLLGFVAAVGLGPGAHNVLLFTVAG